MQQRSGLQARGCGGELVDTRGENKINKAQVLRVEVRVICCFMTTLANTFATQSTNPHVVKAVNTALWICGVQGLLHPKQIAYTDAKLSAER